MEREKKYEKSRELIGDMERMGVWERERERAKEIRKKGKIKVRYHEQFGELILYRPLSMRMMEGHRVCRNGKAFEKRPNKIYMCRK